MPRDSVILRPAEPCPGQKSAWRWLWARLLAPAGQGADGRDEAAQDGEEEGNHDQT